MNLILTDTCFAFGVPATWTAETKDRMITVASDESVAGFSPDVVLREWQVKRSTRSPLARVPWANPREIPREETVLHVEAAPNKKANSDIRGRHRLWAFSTPDVTGSDAESSGLLTICGLLVAGKVLAELTVTMPWRI